MVVALEDSTAGGEGAVGAGGCVCGRIVAGGERVRERGHGCGGGFGLGQLWYVGQSCSVSLSPGGKFCARFCGRLVSSLT